MQFIFWAAKRMDIRSNAEEFARKLVRKHKEQVRIDFLGSESMELDGAGWIRSEVATNN